MGSGVSASAGPFIPQPEPFGCVEPGARDGSRLGGCGKYGPHRMPDPAREVEKSHECGWRAYLDGQHG